MIMTRAVHGQANDSSLLSTTFVQTPQAMWRYVPWSVLLLSTWDHVSAQTVTHSPLSNDSTGLGARTKGFHVDSGTLTIASLLGNQPNNWTGSDLNGRFDGDLQLSAWGLPIKVVAVASTLVPLYGRQASVRILLDTERLRAMDQEAQQRKLAYLDNHIDSLEREREKLARVQMARDRRDRLLSTQVDEPAPSVTRPADTVFVSTPDRISLNPSDTAAMDLFGRASSTSFQANLPQDTTALNAKSTDASRQLGQIARELDDISARIQHLKEEREQVAALANVSKPSSLSKRSFLNVKKLELGDCTPNPSSFLVNGLSFNGFSTEIGGASWTVGVDHGRSFDDEWRRDRVELDRSRSLQRIFFFEQRPEEAPRKLTSVTTRTELAPGLWVGVGSLFASKADIPPGAPLANDDPPELRNQVVEFSVDGTIASAHRLSLSLARSADLRPGATEGVSGDRWSQLTSGDGDNWATRFEWSTDIPGRKARLTGTASIIGTGFNSLGMAFFRSGSKAGGLGFDKGFGKAVRLLVNGTHEERRTSGTGGMDIQRLRSMVTYRVSPSLRLKANFVPQRTSLRTEGAALSRGHQEMISAGADAGLRYGKSSVRFDAEGVRYRTNMGNATNSTLVLRTGITLMLRNGDVLGLRCYAIYAPDTAAALDISSNASFSIGRNAQGEMSGTLPLADPSLASWSFGARKQLASHWSIGVSFSRIGRRDIFFNDDVLVDQNSTYTCEGRVCYTW
ncbi:MAG: hypothetical protein ACO1NQ_10355 [Flavobacteriales bacterium]